ncbi:MAG: phospho-sugar mutase [Eubacteriales bacterium]|jgi:phosphoglucomutase
MQDSRTIYNLWLSIKDLNPEEREELLKIGDNEDEINARFGTELSFGTGGLRAKMMLGTGAMNVFTVAQATEGLAKYIKSTGAGARPVVIAYDSRINSKRFARTAASVLAANQIRVYIFDDLRPTPELSFALRHLGCIAGINITASHNPKEYNGYKVYWEDGAQIAPEQAEQITRYIRGVKISDDIHLTDFKEAVEGGLITIIGSDIDEAYISAVLSQAIDPNIVKKVADKLSVVYTPLHGTGYRLVPEVLRRLGIKKLYVVPEQSQPDGNFPTVDKPNPEYKEAYACGIKLADRVSSDLIIATDPDADRVGVMARGRDGAFTGFTGNQVALLLLDYIIDAYKRSGQMPPEPYAVKSIVTTELMAKICRAGGVGLYNVLTGFKYIGEVIKKKEAEGRGSFIFGAEESCGYLKGTYIRDKDGVLASMLICEMAAHHISAGRTLVDALDELYKKYGYSLERTTEIIFDGYNAQDRIKAVMSSLRQSPPADIAGVPVVSISDYLDGSLTDMRSGQKSSITGFPSSNVLRWELENTDVIIIRPSGTEPKVKIYYLLSGEDKAPAPARLEKYMSAVGELTKM